MYMETGVFTKVRRNQFFVQYCLCLVVGFGSCCSQKLWTKKNLKEAGKGSLSRKHVWGSMEDTKSEDL